MKLQSLWTFLIVLNIFYDFPQIVRILQKFLNEEEKIYLTSKVFREINLQYDILPEKVDFTEFFEKLGNCESKIP